MSAKVVVNTRNLSAPLTGVQRYTSEITSRLPAVARTHAPMLPLRGLAGHLWEQCVLPSAIGNALLWSPSNTGPIAVKRQVVTIHDVAALDHPEWVNPSFARFYRWLTPRLARRVSRVISVSEFTRQRLIEIAGISPERVDVVPNGVGPEFRPRSPSELDDLLTRLRLQSGQYVLTVGSIVPRKNLARLLAAWLVARRRISRDVKLVIAGDRGSASVFAEATLPDSSEGVLWTGRVTSTELPLLYAGAAAFAYVPLYEGFGLPVLEAMASGVAVVTSATTSLPEVAGDTALLVDPMSVDEIASGLVRVVDGGALFTTLRSRALQRAGQFTWDRSAESTWRILEAASE